MKNLKELNKRANELKAANFNFYVERGRVLIEAKNYFPTASEWLAWSYTHLGIRKAMHYDTVKIYEAYIDGQIGVKLQVVPIGVILKLLRNRNLYDRAMVEISSGGLVDWNWLNEQSEA